MENAWLSTIERQAFFCLGAAGEDGGTSDCSLTHVTSRMTEAKGRASDARRTMGWCTTDDGLMHDGRWAGARDVTGNKAEKLCFFVESDE